MSKAMLQICHEEALTSNPDFITNHDIDTHLWLTQVWNPGQVVRIAMIMPCLRQLLPGCSISTAFSVMYHDVCVIMFLTAEAELRLLATQQPWGRDRHPVQDGIAGSHLDGCRHISALHKGTRCSISCCSCYQGGSREGLYQHHQPA